MSTESGRTHSRQHVPASSAKGRSPDNLTRLGLSLNRDGKTKREGGRGGASSCWPLETRQTSEKGQTQRNRNKSKEKAGHSGSDSMQTGIAQRSLADQKPRANLDETPRAGHPLQPRGLVLLLPLFSGRDGARL